MSYIKMAVYKSPHDGIYYLHPPGEKVWVRYSAGNDYMVLDNDPDHRVDVTMEKNPHRESLELYRSEEVREYKVSN